MLSKQQIKILSNIIIKKFNPKKIFIFGSYAHGRPDSESDLDICVITDFNGKRKIDLIRDLRGEIFSVFDVPLDILVFEDNEFEKKAILKNTLEYKILNEGILLND